MTKQQLKTTVNQDSSQKQQHSQNTNQQPQKVTQTQVQQTMKKKIIKKFPFIKTTLNKTHEHNDNKGTDDDELKNWKPVNFKSLEKGNKNNTSELNKLNPNKSVNFANSFLSTLPKPKELNTTNEQINLMKLRQQLGIQKQKKRGLLASSLLRVDQKMKQQQWDGEDEFMKKPIPKDLNLNQIKQVQIQDKQKHSKPSEQNKFVQQQEENQNIVIQRIDWLDDNKSDSRGKKKQLNIADLVNPTWEKQQKLITNLRHGFQDDSGGDSNEGNLNSNKKNTKRFRL